MDTRDVSLRAVLIDHENRLSAVEATLGLGTPILPRLRLLELYEDSMAPIELTLEQARSWARQAMLTDVSSMIALAKNTGDPFPWQGLLARLDVFEAQGFDVQDSIRHIETVAQGALKAQGLELLRPRDVMGHGPLRHRAIGAIRDQLRGI